MTTVPPVSPPPPDGPRRRLPSLGLGLLLVLGCAAVTAVGAVAAVAVLAPRFADAPKDLPAVAYIMDISPRMSLSAGEDTRLAVARAIFADVIRRSDPDLTAGLRVFGSDTAAESCEDTELRVPYDTDNRGQIADELNGLGIGSSAESALGEAMLAAVRELRELQGARFMVVVTGGSDTCNPEAGRLVAEEAERADIELQTFVVGFQVTAQDGEALRRLAEQAAGGRYFEANDAEELRRALESIQRLIEEGTPIEEPPVGELVATPLPEPATEQPTAEPSPEDEELGYDSQTACDHPYFPLRQGAHWEYSYDGLPATWDVTSVDGDLTAATATVVISVEGVTITYNWECDERGVFWFQTGVFQFPDIDEGVEAVLTSQSGSPIPPPQAMQAGAAWTSSYTMEIRAEFEGVAMALTNQVEESHTAGALEQRTTGLGTFEVIPVTTQGTTTTTAFGTSTTSSSTSTCWFALGIGWLGCTTTSGGETSTAELLDYSIP